MERETGEQQVLGMAERNATPSATCCLKCVQGARHETLYRHTLTAHVQPHGYLTAQALASTFPDEATAIEQCIRLLEIHSDVAGFILVLDNLQSINDAAFEERTITRAMAARRSRKARKACEEVQPWHSAITPQTMHRGLNMRVCRPYSKHMATHSPVHMIW